MADNIQLNAGAGGDLLAADEISGAKHQRVKVQFGSDGSATDVDISNPLPVQVESEYLFSDYQATLADGAEIDSGWLDLATVEKYQFEGLASAGGMTLVITSSSGPSGTGATVQTTNVISTTFHLFNVICRQRYMRFQWQNNTGGSLSNCALSIKAAYGVSDKLSVFPLATEPTDFSQAALTQSVIKGQQPDGDYVNQPADGSALETTTNLGIGGIYLSSWVDTDGFKEIEIFISADVPSATDGFELEFTNDTQAGSPTVRRTVRNTFSAEDVTRGFMLIRFPVVLDGFRIRYTNGSTGQSNFYLGVTLHNAVTAPPGTLLEDELNVDVVALTTSSVIVGKDTNDVYQNIKASPSGALLISKYTNEIALGNISTAQSMNKYGYNSDIDAGIAEDITGGGGTYAGQPDAVTPDTVNIVSNNVNDTSAGTGMRTIRIWGLQSYTSTLYTSEIITLNGTSNVTSVNSYVRVIRLEGLTYGSSKTNAGVISVSHTSTPANVFGTIQVGDGKSLIAALTIPFGKKGLLQRLRVDLGVNTASALVVAELRTKPANQVNAGYNVARKIPLYPGGNYDREFDPAIPFEALTDIKGRVASTTDNNIAVGMELDMVFEDA